MEGPAELHREQPLVEQWIPVLVYLALCASVAGSMYVASALLSVRGRKNTEATFDNYECGEEPDGTAWIRFHPRYYIVALVFVAFDVEAAFLFPWALHLRDASWVPLVDMTLFLGILVAGWAYAVRKGAIEWQ
jgi:NADH-quinone oxidoreductase subunit A